LKTKLIIRTTGLLILMASLFVFASCSKTADGNLTDKQIEDRKSEQMKSIESSEVEEKDFTESDEDLTAVDYKEFYEQLSPHGEWVQVQPEEIGLKPKSASYKSIGINNSMAVSNANVGLVYAWKPSATLSVSNGAAGESNEYVPYTNGQWINTDAGWYFKAPTPVEETTSHYGRWVNSPTAGWLWVPGRVWAPAWVDWRQNDQFVSWAPLPPSQYVVNNTMNAPVINDNNYIIVEKRYFLEPEIYKYRDVYYSDGDRILASGFNPIDGIVVVNNTIVNRGPAVNIFETILGRPVELVRIQSVRNYNEIRYTNSEYYVYKHGFKRFKNKDKKWFTVNEPKSYKKHSEWKDRKQDEKEYKKEVKEYNKELKKEEKEIKKEIKKGRDGNNGNDKDRKDNDGGKKKDGNDNGKKNNDNGGKDKGNDNKKGKK
jgi:hypothetical protein